ncbi:EF-hand domain-containing protein [Streptomyces sp. NPDC059752]|uniref:EF-hand domain-containing protein n=1 Tax=unclassified Streptomyces TaxID=2593676 RepID=UPI00365B2CD6
MSDSLYSKHQFDAIDTDGDGYITVEELKAHLRKDPAVNNVDSLVNSTFAFTDNNADNQISYEEFAGLSS